MNKFILALILFLPFVLFSCSDDNENESTSTNNTDLAHVDEDAKIVYVKSPFSVELEMKYSEVCYISAQAHDDSEIIDENTMFTTSIFVDRIKKFTDTSKNASVTYYTL